ncbi:MAG: PIN domain-containing protein [Nitrosomonadales bacterium]|nr:PIN domain-containing protein [Nitrosomonadales bacterium]
MARTAKSGVVHLDTHIVCWLYEGRTELLTPAAMSAIEAGLLQVSPMVQLELTYLHEIGRINRGGTSVLDALEKDIGLGVADISFAHVTKAAETLTWTRDPFDRMIVAHCTVADAELVSKDQLIRKYFSKVIW